ncbi:MAG: 3-deoxy-manno-octulosonate cytidylyltransferase [Candidatus Rokubacteria bacterium]|nr:3-deoxy-manno-octulosonate cytidylyltransferase [Candidatus Rokubacteria bacterium]
MTAIVVIPARYGATRFPGKLLADLHGKPLIQHAWERARELASVSRVLVATDDERISRAVLGFGGEVVMTRVDHPSGTDRVGEVARALSAELIVNLQGDEPLIDTKAVDELVRTMSREPGIVMGTLAHAINQEGELASPHVVKVVVDQEGFALYFSRAPVPFARSRGKHPPLRHIGLYVYRRDFLLTLTSLPPSPPELTEGLEQLRALEHGYRIKVLLSPTPSFGVDTPEDLIRLRELLAKGSRSPEHPGPGHLRTVNG